MAHYLKNMCFHVSDNSRMVTFIKNFWSSQLKQVPISEVELAQIIFFKDLQANVYTPKSVSK